MNNDGDIPKYITVLYWSTRIYTQLFAALIVTLIVVGMFGEPPQIEAPNPQQMPLFFMPIFISGLIFLLPYKHAVNRIFYAVRLIIHLLISVVMMTLVAIYDFPLSGITSIAHSIIFVLLSISSPLSLFLYRKYFLAISSPKRAE